MVEAERGMAIRVQSHQVTQELPLLSPETGLAGKSELAYAELGIAKGT